MALKTSGYSNKAVEHFVMDAGAIYTNLILDDTGAFVSGDLLGATEGGNEFVVNQTIRDIVIDGKKGRGKGTQVPERIDATLTVNLKEITAQNLSQVIANAHVDTTSNTAYDILTSKGQIELDNYLGNVALVARYSQGKPIIIFLYNALSIEGLEIKTEDNKEVVIPVTFAAHWDEDNVANDEAPYKIYFPKVTP